MLEEKGVLVRVGDSLFYHRAALDGVEATLREHLASLYGGAGGPSRTSGAERGGGAATTPQLLLALDSFRQEWTPGPRETAAIVRMLADVVREYGA